jgi:hypothetical protein
MCLLPGDLTNDQKMTTKQPDWEAIERAYRAGALSIGTIAERNGISETAIRKKDKASSPTRSPFAEWTGASSLRLHCYRAATPHRRGKAGLSRRPDKLPDH